MSKRKLSKAKKKGLPPFAAVELKTLNSEAWKLLNSTEAHMYNILKSFYRGDERPFTAPFSQLKQRSRIKHGSTLRKAIDGLEERGWIRVERWYRPGKGCRGFKQKPNVYVLTFMFEKKRW